MFDTGKSQRETIKPSFTANLIEKKLFPGDFKQIDLVGPTQSPTYKYALSQALMLSRTIRLQFC